MDVVNDQSTTRCSGFEVSDARVRHSLKLSAQLRNTHCFLNIVIRHSARLAQSKVCFPINLWFQFTKNIAAQIVLEIEEPFYPQNMNEHTGTPATDSPIKKLPKSSQNLLTTSPHTTLQHLQMPHPTRPHGPILHKLVLPRPKAPLHITLRLRAVPYRRYLIINIHHRGHGGRLRGGRQDASGDRER